MSQQPPPLDESRTESECGTPPPTIDSQGQSAWKCGQCGAKLVFKPGSHALNCPYCGYVNPIDAKDEFIEELDFLAHLGEMGQAADIQEQLTVKCDGCGAESTFDPHVTARDCAFCGADIVATAKSTKQIKPKSLLPFKYDRKQAFEAFGQWVRKRWFAPNKLKNFARLDSNFNGMYVPHWTYDSNTTTYYTGQRGDNYTVTETYTAMENGRHVTKTRQVTKIRWTHVSGTVYVPFDDVLVLGSHSLPRKYTQALEPWDLENLMPYQDEYLSGFQAESYQIDLKESFEIAQGIMDGVIRQTICRDIGGDHQRIHSVQTRHEDVTFKHILLPIWINAYQYKNKVYRILVNARTNEVQGERPYSWIKITLAVLGGAAAIAAGVAIAHYFQ